MYFHWQNLNSETDDRENHKKLWRTGRCWFHFGKTQRTRTISAEWSLRWHTPLFAIRRHHGEAEWSFGAAFIFFAFWLTFSGFYRPPRQYRYSEEEREISIRAHDGILWWTLWRSSNEWHAGDWRNSCWDWRDMLLGKQQYQEIVLTTEKSAVVMPEGSYPCTVTIKHVSWWRPRWPKIHTIQRGHIQMHTPIPFPGKGENGWDCDDDALCTMSTPAGTISEVINKVRQSVEHDRQRYGGDGWLPEDNE